MLGPSPEQAFDEFLSSTDRAEDQLMDPLILAGDDVVPLVLQHVKDRGLPRRRYAICFLGNSGKREALPVLESLYADASELDYIRGDALQAIAMIDLEHGKRLAVHPREDDSYVGLIARSIVAEDCERLEKRSYWEALVGRHD